MKNVTQKKRKNSPIGRTLNRYIRENMKNPAFSKAWKDLDAEFALLDALIRAREEAGLTQSQLAKKVGTKQPALSRLERGGYKKATVETLEKVADALGLSIVISIKPKKIKVAT